MSAETKIVRFARRTKLIVTERDESTHPLHLTLSRNHARVLGVKDKHGTCHLVIFCSRFHENSTDNVVEHTPTHFRMHHHKDQVDTDHSFSFYHNYVDLHVFVWIENTVPVLSLSDRGQENEEIPLVCSSTFLEHYAQILGNRNKLYVRQTKLFPLQKAIIQVSNKETFDWLSKMKFSAGLRKQVSEHGVMLRENDVFLASVPSLFQDDSSFKMSFFFDMKVLECLPLKKGMLTANTEMIISYTCTYHDERSPGSSRTGSDSKTSVSPVQGVGNMADPPLISTFCHKLKFSQSKQSLSKFSPLKDSSSPGGRSFFLNAVLVEQELLWPNLITCSKNDTFTDTHHYIGMSRSLMLKVGVFDGSVLLISFARDPDAVSPNSSLNSKSDSASEVKTKLVIVKLLCSKYDSFPKVFVSPFLIFNISGRFVTLTQEAYFLWAKVFSQPEVDSDVDSGTHISSSWNINIPVAKGVHISIINSPNYSPRAQYDLALKKYFQTPRLISLGDIVAIRSSDDPEFWQSSSDDTVYRFPVIYFQVTKIDPPFKDYPSVLYDYNVTSLFQVGSLHSYVPMVAESYLSNTDISYWKETDAAGLELYTDKIESTIKPHLFSSFEYREATGLSPSILVTGPVGCGKSTAVMAVSRRLCLQIYKVNCHFLLGESLGAIEARLKNVFNGAGLYSPCILLLQNIHVLGKDKDHDTEDPRLANSFCDNVKQINLELRDYPVIIIATTNSPPKMVESMYEAFLHQVSIEVPREKERKEMLCGLLQNEDVSSDISLPHLAQRTASFVLGDLASLVMHAKREAFKRIISLCSDDEKLSQEDQEDIVLEGVVLQAADFDNALDKLQAAHSDAIGAPKIPDITWDDVGGLSNVKDDILDTIQLPLQHPELLSAGLRRSGVLLYGPPGTGKTLMAKAVATECSLNFLSVKGPELINMYVGQSEENVREVFQRARDAAPCVIFFDELDSLAPNRGRSGDSGGVMDRVVSQLLAELDGLSKSSEVFVIGATNRPDLIDPALLRPGRFDKLLYLGISEDRKTQMLIMKALTRKYHFEEGFKFENFIDQCPLNLSGADLYALCSDAMLNAVKKKIMLLEDGEDVDQSVVEVSEEDFITAAENLTPSVSETEIQYYKDVQASFSSKK